MVMAAGPSAKLPRRPSQDGVQNTTILISPKRQQSIHRPPKATLRVKRSLASIRTNGRIWVRNQTALERISPRIRLVPAPSPGDYQGAGYDSRDPRLILVNP